MLVIVVLHCVCGVVCLLQLRHSQQVIVKKEELLRLYASEQQEESLECTGSHGSQLQPEWVQLLSEECQELRESNLLLQSEADKLKRETAEVELKEKELVQHCLEQFSEHLVGLMSMTLFEL